MHCLLEPLLRIISHCIFIAEFEAISEDINQKFCSDAQDSPKKAHQIAETTRKLQIYGSFTFEQPNAVRTRKPIRIGEILHRKICRFKQSRSLFDSLMNAIYSQIAIKERIADSEPYKARGETKSTNESETQLSAPTSQFKQSPKRLAQKGQGKQRICPITEQAFHITKIASD